MQTHFKQFQQEMRRNMPLSEVILWQYIRNKKLGVKFRRQFTIGNRILDFYSPEIKLGIEADGESHYVAEEKQLKDAASDAEFVKYGIKILRFINPDIKKNLDGVIQTIKENIDKRRKYPPPADYGHLPLDYKREDNKK